MGAGPCRARAIVMSMIYLDNAASTRPAPEVLEAAARAARDHFANPSSAHALGAAAARAIEVAREQVATLLGAAAAGEIVFTSGGTEADALGLIGAATRARGRHLVVTAIEHPAVLRTAELLVGRGYALTVVPPDRAGAVRAADVIAALRPDTVVVAVMLVNNVLGTIQPVQEIAQGLARVAPDHPHRPHLHVDAVQGVGLVPLRVSGLGADSLAISGHKLHGPKGTGALWVRSGARLAPLWDGGRQERGLRSGTENLPGWVGLGIAAQLAVRQRDTQGADPIRELRDRLERGVLAALADLTEITQARPTITAGAAVVAGAAGAPSPSSGLARAPHISSLSFPGLPAEPMLHALEARGVYASAGSACASRTRGPNHVLEAIGVDDQTAVLRFSLSRETTPADIDGAVAALREAIVEIAPMVKTGARR
jgi:cysteine desulfurase